MLRTVSDSGPHSDYCWLILLLAGLGDCVVDASEVAVGPSARGTQWWMPNVLVTIIYMENLPIVGQESGLDVLGKSDGGVSVDGNV